MSNQIRVLAYLLGIFSVIILGFLLSSSLLIFQVYFVASLVVGGLSIKMADKYLVNLKFSESRLAWLISSILLLAIVTLIYVKYKNVITR